MGRFIVVTHTRRDQPPAEGNTATPPRYSREPRRRRAPEIRSLPPWRWRAAGITKYPIIGSISAMSRGCGAATNSLRPRLPATIRKWAARSGPFVCYATPCRCRRPNRPVDSSNDAPTLVGNVARSDPPRVAFFNKCVDYGARGL